MVSTIEGTLIHAVFLAKHLNGCDPQCAITAALLELAIPPRLIGFDYLEKAILLYYEDPTQTLTKEIYPSVGKSYNPSASSYQVERQIRTAINEAWRDRDDSAWNCYFPQGITEKPTNGKFISMVARFVQLWQGCCEGVGYGNE